MHLFTYGTLMFPAIWDRVVPRRFASQAGIVRGFVVRRARGELYPVMLATDEPQAEVTGLVYFDVDDDALALLDAYESELYDRAATSVTLSDGRTVECQAYILPPARREFADDQGWSAAWFEANALDEYLRSW